MEKNGSKADVTPIRIIHTADVHLDTSFGASALPPDKGRGKREALRRSFLTIVEHTRASGAAALVIAGDLYEEDRVSRDTIASVNRAFERLAPMPVVIAPGNHDPASPQSPYAVEDWPDNVHVFGRESFEVIEAEGCPVVFVGYGFAQPHVRENLMSGLPLVETDKPVILVAHGADANHQTPEGLYAPFNAGQLKGRGVAYAALGHEHRSRCVREDDPVAWYPGVPEARGFDETGDLCFLEVELAEGGARVFPRPSGIIAYVEHEIDCTEFASREEVISAISSLAPAEGEIILRVTLSGRPQESLDLDLDAIRERLSDRFFHLILRDGTEAPYDYEEIARERTVRGRFVETMLDRIASASDEERPVAERALRLGVEAFRPDGGALR